MTKFKGPYIILQFGNHSAGFVEREWDELVDLLAYRIMKDEDDPGLLCILVVNNFTNLAMVLESGFKNCFAVGVGAISIPGYDETEKKLQRAVAKRMKEIVEAG